MPLDTRIALGIEPIKLADPVAQYNQFAQARAAGNQNALAEYQLGAAQRADVNANALNKAYANATDPKTGEIDYGKVRNYLAQNDAGAQIPGVIKGQAEYQKAATDAKKAESDLVDAKLKQSRQFLDTIDPAAPGAVDQYIAWHRANHNDPVLGPVLKARGVTAEQSMNTIQAAVQQGPQAFADLINKSKLGTEKFMEMNKPTLTPQNLGGTERVLATPGLGGDATVVPGSVGTVTEKPLMSTLGRMQADRQKLIDFGVPPTDTRIKQYDAMIAKETTHAPGTVVNVSQSTEKKYGEAFGNKVADRDVALLDTATRAPDLAANANRVLGILSQGNVFTGTAADMKLNMARALNLAGADNNEKIANTELLMSGLARQTLGAVKSSGLGTGQGFTDKDLQFLQDVEGGRITMNAQTIRRLAELSHSAADKSADAWNKRVKDIPKSATEGTGLSTEPITVPKRFGAASIPAAPAVGAVQNGYKFKGGNPAVAANWEKL